MLLRRDLVKSETTVILLRGYWEYPDGEFEEYMPSLILDLSDDDEDLYKAYAPDRGRPYGWWVNVEYEKTKIL